MARIRFVSDDHYGQHCGATITPAFKGHDVVFSENDWWPLEESGWPRDTDLLVLHMIAGTCGNALPGDDAEALVREWVQNGGPVLMLHGSSAAFWHWDWWRTLVGWRWVRPDDPDGIARSTHPVRPYAVRVAKTRHPLARRLHDFDLPEDEIYTDLEQVCPSWTLLETVTDEGTFPMAHVHTTPFGGHMAAFIPGHAPEVTRSEAIHQAVRTIADWLIDPDEEADAD